MGDNEWIAHLASITDPKVACKILVENEQYLGYDPYYKDLRKALLDMCERCGGGDGR